MTTTWGKETVQKHSCCAYANTIFEHDLEPRIIGIQRAVITAALNRQGVEEMGGLLREFGARPTIVVPEHLTQMLALPRWKRQAVSTRRIRNESQGAAGARLANKHGAENGCVPGEYSAAAARDPSSLTCDEPGVNPNAHSRNLCCD